MKTKFFNLFKYSKFTYGEQHVSQFILFESKYFFSIIFFYFHKTDGIQDRYHTHAFNALSIKLWGKYIEYKLKAKNPEMYYIQERKKQIFKFFPRDSYHKIGNSNGCATILLSGPWKKTWEEYKAGKTTVYNWGKKLVA